MHASMRWAVVLVSGIVLIPSGAEAISYTFSDCQQTQLCGAPAPQPESTQSVSTTYDFSNEAAVAASIASVYFSSDGALSGMPQYDGGTTGTSDPAVLGPTLSSAMAFDDIITSLDEGSSTADGLRISAHLQGMDPNASLDIYMARDSFSVPEPAMMALFGLTLLAAATRARRRR